MSCCGSNCGGFCGCNCGCCKPSSPCQGPFPDTCEALEPASIPVRIIVEDEANCKRTWLSPDTNSIAFYDADDQVLSWRDGSTASPLTLPELQDQDGGTVPSLVVQQSDFEIAGMTPTSTQDEPEVMLGTDGTGWATTERSAMFGAGSGALVRDATGTQLAAWQSGAVGSILTLDSSLNARFVDASTTNFGAISARGVSVSQSTVDTINLSAQFLCVYSSTGGIIQIKNVVETITRTTSGAGGIDVGSFNTATAYYIYVIYNSTTADVSAVYSLSSTSPTLPAGYTHYRMVSWFGASGSAAFPNFSQYMNNYMYDTGVISDVAIAIPATGVGGGSFNTITPGSWPPLSEMLIRVTHSVTSSGTGAITASFGFDNAAGSDTFTAGPTAVTTSTPQTVTIRAALTRNWSGISGGTYAWKLSGTMGTDATVNIDIVGVILNIF